MSIKVIKFSAPWCPSCNILASGAWPRLVEANPDVIFEEMNTDASANAVTQYGLKSIPTLIFFKDDVEVERVVGLNTIEKYQTILAGLK